MGFLQPHQHSLNYVGHVGKADGIIRPVFCIDFGLFAHGIEQKLTGGLDPLVAGVLDVIGRLSGLGVGGLNGFNQAVTVTKSESQSYLVVRTSFVQYIDNSVKLFW